MDKKPKNIEIKESEATEFPGYPLYPASDDIYAQANKEPYIAPEENEEIIFTAAPDPDAWNEDDTELTGDDLDVPGAELDDENELTGNEDEENNYYSLGGDNHDD